MDMQAQSFRTRKAYRWKPVRTGTPRPGFNTDITASLYQSLSGYRTLAQAKYRTYFHDWQPDNAFISAIQPSNTFQTAFFSAISSLVGHLVPKPRFARRGQELLWNTVPRTSAALFEAEEILSGIFSSQLASFRSLKRPGLNRFLHQPDYQNGWVAFEELFAQVAVRRGAMDQLLAVDWIRRRRPYRSEYFDWNDLSAWMFVPASFDPALTSVFSQLTGSYRSLSGRKLDLFRNLDTTLDAWLTFTGDQQVPVWAPAFQGLFNQFLVGKRRVTHHPFLHESIHDLSFLHDVLNLVDAPFGVPRAHWREISGAIRRRRRNRRR